MIRGIIRRLISPKLYLNLHILNKYTQKRAVYKFAPYQYELFSELIKKLNANSKAKFQNFLCEPESNLKNIYVRIDVDFQDCVDNLESFLKYLLERKIHAGVYIRVDGIEYDPSECKEMVNKYKDFFEFGLHTSCYREVEFLQNFNQELSRFKEEFGYMPQSLSVHGYGSQFTDRRQALYEYFRDKQNEISELKYYDCFDLLRKYTYVVQDCHLKGGKRFVYNDFKSPPSFFSTSSTLILVHTCYWKP